MIVSNPRPRSDVPLGVSSFWLEVPTGCQLRKAPEALWPITNALPRVPQRMARCSLLEGYSNPCSDLSF